MQAHKQDGHLTAGAWARKVTDERVLCSVPLFLTCEPSIAPTTFGKLVRSASVAINEFTSERVSGNFMRSLRSSYRPLTTSYTASITVDFPTLNAGQILEYEFL